MKRFLVYILMVLSCFLLQTTLFQWLELADIVPNILIIMTVSIGYMRGTKEGMLVGALCGLCIDLMYGDVIGYYALLYMSIGFASGYANFFYEPSDFAMPLVLIGAGDLIYGILFYILSFLLRARLHFFYYVRRIIVPELIYTIIVSIIVYKIIHSINEMLIKFEHKED